MKLFVWDLHGTLEQGNEDAVVELSNKIAQDFGYTQQFTPQMGRDLYGRKWYEYFESLLPNETHERHLQLQEACFAYSNSPGGASLIAKYIRPSNNAHEILGLIKERHDQIVISNTVPESLPIFLSALEMDGYFPSTHAFALNQHAKIAKRSKADVAWAFIKGRKYDEIIVIGDSDKDMQLADDITAKAYLYAHDGTPFRSERGHYRINDLIELADEL